MRRTVAIAAIVAAAAVAVWFAWRLRQRPFLERWGEDAAGLVSAARIGAQAGALSAKPHTSGMPANAEAAAQIERRLASLGLAPWSDVHEADLWEPVSLRLALAAPTAREFDLHGRGAQGDAASTARDEPPFLAYSPDADLEAPIVYANFGAPADYEALRRAGVDPRGKVAIVRAFGGCRGGDVAAAERAGVAALLVYTEPGERGMRERANPEKGGSPPEANASGSLLKYFRMPGDPRRARELGVDVLPTIPALAIPAAAAEALLKETGGPGPPAGWKGSLEAPYTLGSGKARVRLRVRGRTFRASLRNVLASIPGSDPNSPQVLAMGHYDAWANGGVDPGSGAAVILEAADALSGLTKKGWQPVRGILFAFWDGGEWGMFGSTAWLEAHLGGTGLPVAAAINVAPAARGSGLTPGLTPGLRGVFDEALARVADSPGAGKPTKESSELSGLPGFSSDAAPFLGLTPVPVVEMTSGRDEALARSVVLMTGALATPRLFPFRFDEVAAFTRREMREIQARFPGAMGWLPGALRPLDTHLSAFEAAAAAWDAYARSRSGSDRTRAQADGLASLAIAALGTRGTFGRGCVLWGPSETTGCAGLALPGLDEAVRRGDRAAVGREVDRLATAFSRSRDYLVAGDWLGRGNVSKRAPLPAGRDRH
jgi:hypothetical protein